MEGGRKRSRSEDSSIGPDSKASKQKKGSAAAAAAAARINASLNVKREKGESGKEKVENTVNPRKNVQLRVAELAARINAQVSVLKAKTTSKTMDLNDLHYEARLQLLRTSLQKEIEEKCGVSLSVHGKYFEPGASNPKQESKLQLLIEGEAANVEKTFKRIEAIIAENTPQTEPSWQWRKISSQSVDQNKSLSNRLATGHGPVMGGNEARGLAYGLHRQNFTHQKAFNLVVGIEASLSQSFDLEKKIAGAQKSHLTYIMKVCPGALVSVHGRGSANGGNEAMYIRVFGNDNKNLLKAKEMAEDLIASVRKDFKAWKLERKRIAQERAIEIVAQDKRNIANAPWKVQSKKSDTLAKAKPEENTRDKQKKKPSRSTEAYDPLDAGSSSSDED